MPMTIWLPRFDPEFWTRRDSLVRAARQRASPEQLADAIDWLNSVEWAGCGGAIENLVTANKLAEPRRLLGPGRPSRTQTEMAARALVAAAAVVDPDAATWLPGLKQHPEPRRLEVLGIWGEEALRLLDEASKVLWPQAVTPAATPTADAPEPAGGGRSAPPAASWRTVAIELEARHDRGEPYPGAVQLGAALGCSKGLVLKAIKKSGSAKLRAWAKGRHGTKAISFGAAVMDARTQAREPDPASAAEDAELARLAREAQSVMADGSLSDAERRRRLDEMSAAEPGFEPSPVGPTGRPRATRIHKRV